MAFSGSFFFLVGLLSGNRLSRLLSLGTEGPFILTGLREARPHRRTTPQAHAVRTSHGSYNDKAAEAPKAF